MVLLRSRKRCTTHSSSFVQWIWKCYLEPSSRLLSLRSGRWPRCQLSLSLSFFSEPDGALSGGGMPTKRCTGLMAHKTGSPRPRCSRATARVKRKPPGQRDRLAVGQRPQGRALNQSLFGQHAEDQRCLRWRNWGVLHDPSQTWQLAYFPFCWACLVSSLSSPSQICERLWQALNCDWLGCSCPSSDHLCACINVAAAPE